MEFWGIEVKAGEQVKAEPTDECLIHLSHVALGEVKKDKGNETVNLFARIGDQKVVLGTLSTQNNQQITFDLVFEKEVELSHNWKNGSVYFLGYETELPQGGYFTSDDEPTELANEENAKLMEEIKAASGIKSNAGKLDASSNKKSKSVQIKDAKTEESDDDDDDSDSDDSDNTEDGSDDGMSVDDDSVDDEEDSGDEDETPKKASKSNKRPTDSATKTPVPAKKQKQATPQKTDGKKEKVAHTATPHPAKAAAKTSANGTNTKPQTPKSGGKFTCGSCDRAFGSDVALQSHSKAKHGAK